jgi:hypothetical protein
MKKLLLMLVISFCAWHAFSEIPLRIENNTTNWLYVTVDESDRSARYYVQPGLPLEIPWPDTAIYLFSGYGSAQRTLEDLPQTLYVAVEASEADDGFYGLNLMTVTHATSVGAFRQGGTLAAGIGLTCLLIRRFRSGVRTAVDI